MDKTALIKELDSYIAANREQYTADLAKLIEIESVGTAPEGKYVFGKGSAAALDKALEIGAGYGFSTENHDYYCASIVYGNKEKELGMIAHMDVVPAGDGWSYPPYKLTVENGLLIGRGTEDDKGPAIAALYAMRFLKDTGKELPFSVRLLLGGDEERGMNDLPYFLKTHKAPFFSFTPDSTFPVCTGEKGIGKMNFVLDACLENIVEMSGGTVTNAVAGKATAILKGVSKLPEVDNISIEYKENTTVITAVGKTAHAAYPEAGVSAISALALYLLDNATLSDGERKALGFLADCCGDYLGNKLGIACEDKLMGYLTCIGGVLTTENGKLKQNFNVRYPHPDSWDGIIAKASENARKYGASLASHSHGDGYCFDPQKPEIKALTASCELVTGKECKPFTMGGGTYARSFPNTVAFGSTLDEYRGLLGEDRGHAHDRDEYLSVAELEMSIKIFVLAILDIAELHQ